jgi:hypothetical protein
MTATLFATEPLAAAVIERPVPRRAGLEADLVGDVYKTAAGWLRATYELELEGPHTQAEVHAAVERRLVKDQAGLRRRAGRARLADWYGGWTTEGVGRFGAEIWADRPGRPARWLGQLQLVVFPVGRAAALGQAC